MGPTAVQPRMPLLQALKKPYVPIQIAKAGRHTLFPPEYKETKEKYLPPVLFHGTINFQVMRWEYDGVLSHNS